MPFLVWVYEDAQSRQFLINGADGNTEDVFPCFMQCCPLVEDCFATLKQELSRYLDESFSISFYAAEQNTLTLKLLEISSKLLSYGYFSKYDDVKELCTSMVVLLNPTHDSPRGAREHTAKTEPATLAKTRAVSVLQQAMRTLTHWRIENLLVSLRAVMGDRVFDTAYSVPGSFESALGLSLGGAVFGARAAQRLRVTLNDLFTGTDAKAFEANVMHGETLNSTLLELLMYEDDRLFESALELLLTRFRTYTFFGTSLSRITVLSTEELPVFEKYDKLQLFMYAALTNMLT